MWFALSFDARQDVIRIIESRLVADVFQFNIFPPVEVLWRSLSVWKGQFRNEAQANEL